MKSQNKNNIQDHRELSVLGGVLVGVIALLILLAQLAFTFAQTPGDEITFNLPKEGGDRWIENQDQEISWVVPKSIFTTAYDKVDVAYFMDQQGDSRPIAVQRVTESEAGATKKLIYRVGSSGETQTFGPNENVRNGFKIRLVIEPVDNIEGNTFTASSPTFSVEKVRNEMFLNDPHLTIKEVTYDAFWPLKEEGTLVFDSNSPTGGANNVFFNIHLQKDNTNLFVENFRALAVGQGQNHTFTMPNNFEVGQAVVKLSGAGGVSTWLVNVLPARTIEIGSPIAGANLYRGETTEIKFKLINFPQNHYYGYPDNIDIELVTILNGQESDKVSIANQGFHSGVNGENIHIAFIPPNLPFYANDNTTFLRIVSRRSPAEAKINIKVVDRIRNQELEFDKTHAESINGFVFTPIDYDPATKPQVEAKVWIKNSGTADILAANLFSASAFVADKNFSEEMKSNQRIIDLPALAPGESKLVSLGSYEADSYIFGSMLTLDHGQQIYEINENNNHEESFQDIPPYIPPVNPVPNSGTYYSKKISVITGTQKLTDLNSVRAAYNDLQTQNDKNATKFSLGFFDAANNNIGRNKFGFDSEGYLPINFSGSNEDFDLTQLKSTLGVTWIESIKTVQFKIFMQTEDQYGAIQQPWVEAMQLKYVADNLSQIGTISGPTTINVTPNGEVTKIYTIRRYVQESFVGRIQLSIIPEQAANAPEITFISPQLGLVDMRDGNDIQVTVKFKDTGAVEGSEVNLQFQGVEVDSGDAPRSLLPLQPKFTVGAGDDDDDDDDGDEGDDNQCTPSPCPEDGITINITAPYEGMNGLLESARALFTLRVNNTANANIFQRSNIKLNASEQAAVIVGELEPGEYSIYLRSNRHLWKKAKTNLQVVAGTNSYTLSFDQLTAGDIHENDVINVLDFTNYSFDVGKTAANLLSDFDEGGTVNSLDSVFLFFNYTKKGDLPQ